MRHGFSLVELSIVLVVLGLLVGGVLTGQSLIRAAELRSVTTEFQKYQSAVNTFRDQYLQLPGDMSDATSFWGTMATGTCPNATAGTGTQTCNGNGNGQINLSGAISQSNEQFTFWQQLANAGLIEGNYTGIAGSGRNDHALADQNVPKAKMGGNAVWTVEYGSGGGSFRFSYLVASNNFIVGGTSANWNSGAVLKPEEAWNIDTKVDDGHATRGKVWAVRWDNCTPAISTTDYQNYDLSVTSKACGLAFLNPF